MSAEDPAVLIEDIEARESKLSDWERQFVDDLSKVLERGGSLTPGQQTKLEEIWERVT